jgi:hypothetical protein
MKDLTIERRIVVALRDSIKSDAVAELIQEVGVAAQAADEKAAEARAQALDPTITIDVAKVSVEITAAELTRDRLKVALPKLRARYTEVRRQEDVTKWKAEAEKLSVRRDELRMEFAALLPVELIKRIPEHLNAMRAFDREIDTLNARRPDDQSVRPLHYATPELARELKIPDMEKPGQFLWPPPEPNLALQYLASMPPDPFIISEAAKSTYIKERDRRVLEDNRRQIAEAEQRQREREQREAAAEMAKIKEADHMGRAAS